MYHPHSSFFATTALALACAVLLNACGDKSDAPPPASSAATGAASAPGRTAPAIPVSTAVARAQTMTVALEATGTVQPVSAVEVKAQLSSVITQVHVKEGQNVRAGEPLFTLDTRADSANVSKLQAQLHKDQALLTDAQRQLARSRELLAQNFIAQGVVDTHQTTVESQQATLAADQASLEAARVPLSYGQVVAASAGRIGTIGVFAGTAVQANVTPLTTLTRLDPIDVAFNLPQSSLPDLLRLLPSGQTPVKVTLPDDKKERLGRLSFVDSSVDAATGTVKVKARFANADSGLWPGAFVKVVLQTKLLEDAIAIPTAAIIQSARGPVVYVADKGKAALRPIKVLASQGAFSAVSNLQAGEKVVVNGRQNLRPDSPITEKTDAPASPAAKSPSP